jgi:SAM-dependent methyltransferase
MAPSLAAKVKLQLFLRKRGRSSFIQSLKSNARLLDVGCGNDSPSRCKILRPDLYYVGIDIADFNQKIEPNKVADEYILTSPEQFSETIGNHPGRFDAAISSHNLEHCNDPDGTLKAIAGSLAPGGRLYLAFPCEASRDFPKRKGTLCFFDDPTHREVPVLSHVIQVLEAEGLKIDYKVARYRPFLLCSLGLSREIESRLRKKVVLGTWEFYGFETIIWASK